MRWIDSNGADDYFEDLMEARDDYGGLLDLDDGVPDDEIIIPEPPMVDDEIPF